MSQAQKIIKYLAIGLGLFLAISIIGWIVSGLFFITGMNQVVNFGGGNVNMITYSQEYQEVENLKIDIKQAKLYIKKGETLKIEADQVNEDWKIKQDGNTLKISNVGKSWNMYSDTPVLTIYIPETINLNKTEIDFGAGETEIEYLVSNSIDLDFGAGKVDINNIEAEKTNIECGAGEVIISNADLNNLKLEAGIGRLEYSGYIRGKSDIECGVGEVDLNLKGGEAIYKIFVEKGLGDITLNGDSIKNKTDIGDGENKIDIEGGIGSIKIKIEE
ncbi:MAG: DUF4097 domain-containing protein [Clostridia bacterium]|nr:DUF4097 domain-containing protein [Clostridia bacterium]